MKERKCKGRHCRKPISPRAASGLCATCQNKVRWERRVQRAEFAKRVELQEHKERMDAMREMAIAAYRKEREERKAWKQGYMGIPQGQPSDRHAMRRGPNVRYDYTGSWK
jgi:hypothetical protein